MNRTFSNVLSAAFLALLFSSCVASAGEPWVNQKFDGVDLNALPPGWTKSEPSMISIVPAEGHGSVLRFENKDNKYPFVMLTTDASSVIGKTLIFATNARFPAAYIPIADKLWASPKLSIEFKDAAGKSLVSEGLVPQAGKAEWQELKKSLTVPAGTVNIVAQFCVQFVSCEVFFDSLTITVTDAPAVVTPPVAAVPPAAGTPPTPAAPAVPPAAGAPVANAAKPAVPAVVKPPAAPGTPAAPVDPDSPAGIAARAPKKTFDDGGMTFNPDYALKLQKSYPSKTVTAGTALFVGPGFAEKVGAPKLQSAWRALPMSPKVTGAAGSPRALLTVLPEMLSKEKPEVVFISSDAAIGRKATSSEAEDWEDVARLCMRAGAVPVLVPHTQDGKDEQFDHIVQAFKKTADLNGFLLVSPAPAEAFPKRTENLLKLLETYVFLRTKPAEAGKPGAPGTPGKSLDE